MSDLGYSFLIALGLVWLVLSLRLSGLRWDPFYRPRHLDPQQRAWWNPRGGRDSGHTLGHDGRCLTKGHHHG